MNVDFLTKQEKTIIGKADRRGLFSLSILLSLSLSVIMFLWLAILIYLSKSADDTTIFLGILLLKYVPIFLVGILGIILRGFFIGALQGLLVGFLVGVSCFTKYTDINIIDIYFDSSKVYFYIFYILLIVSVYCVKNNYRSYCVKKRKYLLKGILKNKLTLATKLYIIYIYYTVSFLIYYGLLLLIIFLLEVL